MCHLILNKIIIFCNTFIFDIWHFWDSPGNGFNYRERKINGITKKTPGKKVLVLPGELLVEYGEQDYSDDGD